MKSGTHPHKLDVHDYSFHKNITPWVPRIKLGLTITGTLASKEYTYDAGFPIPNQDLPDTRFNPPLPPIPSGCTGECTTSICMDEDKALYNPKYTYDMTCMMENHDESQGCDIRNSAKSLTIYGLEAPGDTPTQTLARKRGAYFMIDLAPGYDWFDSFRLALRANGRSISMATPWFEEWEIATGIDGVLISTFDYNGIVSDYNWHDSKICGEIVLPSGEDALIDISWQGNNFGDDGKCYFTRETFNKAFDIYGTLALTPGPAIAPGDIQYVKLTILQQALVYLNDILAIIGLQKTIYA